MKFGVSREERVQKAIERMVNNDYDNVDAKTIKKENNAIKVCVCVLSFFLAITIAVFSVINHYLSKINYGDIKAVECLIDLNGESVQRESLKIKSKELKLKEKALQNTGTEFSKEDPLLYTALERDDS